jgi:hypothetical protein
MRKHAIWEVSIQWAYFKNQLDVISSSGLWLDARGPDGSRQEASLGQEDVSFQPVHQPI